MSERYYEAFENWVSELFVKAEYFVQRKVRLQNQKIEVDLIAEKDDIKYCVEIKYSYVTERVIRQICSIAEEINMIPILVTAHCIDEDKINRYKSEQSNLIVIDIKNLLFAVKDFPAMRNELISIIPYSVEKLEPREGFLIINKFQHNSYTESLIREIETCKAGKSDFFYQQ